MSALLWLLDGIWSGITGPIYVLTHLFTVLDFSDGKNIMRVIYYGASKDFFFFLLNIAVIVFVIGWFRRAFLWRVVGGMEWVSNTIGRTFAWAGLIMVLQQIMVIFLQSIFRLSDIGLGPFGAAFIQPVGWYGDSLKFYNALVVALCASYTFVQGGHVRVDLIYSGVAHRTKRIIDMAGSLLFMIPAITLTWFYAWYFLWRHLITPKVSATDPLSRMEAKARILKWNVETIGFSPNGFNAYFLFKVLIVAYCALIFLQAWAFFYRSFLEFVEGEEAAGKNLDKDRLGDDDAERVAEIH